MASSLSYLVGNLAEGLHKNKCMDCKSCLKYVKVKEHLLLFICSDCHKNYKKDFDKDLANRFESTYKFLDKKTLKKILLMLRKGVYLYE